jgi:hypothetical protein
LRESFDKRTLTRLMAEGFGISAASPLPHENGRCGLRMRMAALPASANDNRAAKPLFDHLADFIPVVVGSSRSGQLVAARRRE